MTKPTVPELPSLSNKTTFLTLAQAFFVWLTTTFIDWVDATATAMNFNSTNDTSTSSVLIGLGSKSLTVSTNKSFLSGMYVVLADTAAPSTNSMVAQVTSYNATTGALVVNAISTTGSGTKTAWTISQSAKPFDLAVLSVDTGASLIGFKQSGTGAVSRTLQDKGRETVSVKDFGAVGDGVTDDTVAIQAAIDYCIANIKNLHIDGNFRVSSVTVGSANGLVIVASGSLFGVASGSYDAVLVIKNSASVAFVGSLDVSASYNEGYTSAIAVYTDNATQASLIQFYNVSAIAARLGWKFGRTTEPDALISEITVHGGFLYGCPSAAEAVGTQTVVNFVGSQLLTGTNGGSGAWLTLPRIGVKSVGAAITVTGGELGVFDVTTGAAIKLEPSVSATYGNAYGSIVLYGVFIESASQYVTVTNPLAIPTIEAGSGFVSLQGCRGYHSQNSFPMIASASDFSGKISVGGCNFYAGGVRSQPNISCLGLANVWMDDDSFGENFTSGLSSISGGIVHFSRRQIFYVSDAAGQAFPLATPTVVKWTTPTNTEDTTRFSSNYSSATGMFTVPSGGLKGVSITVSLRTSSPSDISDIAIHLNGAFYAAIPTMMGGAGNSGFIRGTVDLGDWAAGTTIDVRETQYGNASVSNAGQYENMSLIAWN